MKLIGLARDSPFLTFISLGGAPPRNGEDVRLPGPAGAHDCSQRLALTSRTGLPTHGPAVAFAAGLLHPAVTGPGPSEAWRGSRGQASGSSPLSDFSYPPLTPVAPPTAQFPPGCSRLPRRQVTRGLAEASPAIVSSCGGPLETTR